MFRFMAFYFMIWSSLALDQSSKQEYHGDLAKFLELENFRRSSAVDSPCFCGSSSVKCCLGKRVLEEVGIFHYFLRVMLYFNSFARNTCETFHMSRTVLGYLCDV